MRDGSATIRANEVNGQSPTRSSRDPAGHHVREWYINWGDETTQTLGSIGGTSNPSDSSSSDPTGSHPLQTTDTITFSHTYPTGRRAEDYPVTIDALTSENLYTYSDFSATVNEDGIDPWPSDSLLMGAYNTSGGFGGGIGSDGSGTATPGGKCQMSLFGAIA
jgi:hypothetical protein